MELVKQYRLLVSLFALIFLSLAFYAVEAQSTWWTECQTFDDCGMRIEAAGSVSAQTIRSSSGVPEYLLTCPDGTSTTLNFYPDFGYAKSYCSVNSNSANISNSNATGDSDCIITGDDINIRNGPGTSYVVINTLRSDEEFFATGQNNGWWYGIFYGQSAWISGDVSTATGDTCNSLAEVDAPVAPRINSTGNNSGIESQVDTVSCLNFAHLRPPASDIAQTEVEFAWTEATGAGFYELVIYDFNDNVAATFSTEATTIRVNLGLVATGPSMSWEVRAYDASGLYACVTVNSGQITVQADPNPSPLETEEPQPEVTAEPIDCDVDFDSPECS